MANLVDSQIFSLLDDQSYTFPESVDSHAPVLRRRGGLTPDHLEPIAVRKWTGKHEGRPVEVIAGSPVMYLKALGLNLILSVGDHSPVRNAA